MALKQGLQEKLREPALGPAVIAGLADTLGLIDATHATRTRRIEILLQERPESRSAWETGWNDGSAQASNWLRNRCGDRRSGRTMRTPNAGRMRFSIKSRITAPSWLS